MTAIIVAKRRRAGSVSVVADAAQYQAAHGIISFADKVYSIPHWPGAIAAAGVSCLHAMIVWSLAQDFATFDDAVAGMAEALPRAISLWQKPTEIVAGYRLPTTMLVIFAGFSSARGQPEAYVARTDDTIPPGETREEAEGSKYWGERPFALTPLGDVTMTPVPHDLIVPARFEGVDLDGTEDEFTWSMRKVLQMQRHMLLPPEIGGIGGFATLTTVSADGISQRVIERWPEDKIGPKLEVGTIDWDRWHRENPKPYVVKQLRLRR